MTEKTFEKTSSIVVKPSTKRRFTVWVVVRHTRSGDDYRDVMFEKNYPGNSKLTTRAIAMDRAEEIAAQAARDYGQGSASVFKGTLILSNKAEVAG